MRRGDRRVAVKENETVNNKSPYSESKDSPFKKRPFGPVLKGRQTKSPAPGAPRGWVTANLVPAAACHFAQTQKERIALPFFFERHVISRGLNGKDAASYRGVSPDLRAKSLAALGCAPKRACGRRRRATRRCPPWTRTGLMSGDRKATRYWALGFGYGAAPAAASPAQAEPKM